MAKLTRAEKIKKIEEASDVHFKAGKNHDDVVEILFMELKEYRASKQISLNEIHNYTRTYGVEKGYILTEKQRIANLTTFIEETGLDQHSRFEEFETLIDTLALQHDVKVNKVTPLVTKYYDKQEWIVPKPIKINDWQVAGVEYYLDLKGDDLPTFEGLTEAIKPHVQNTGNYVGYLLPVFHRLRELDIKIAEELAKSKKKK